MQQEIRHLRAAKAARDQELAEAQKQLEAERFQVEELERNLLSQVSFQHSVLESNFYCVGTSEESCVRLKVARTLQQCAFSLSKGGEYQVTDR